MKRLTNYSNGERLTLELPGLPTSANAIWRSCVAARGRKVYSYRSEEYRAWLRRVEAEILARGVRIPDDWPFVGVELILTPPNRRDVDVDNRFKALFDALTAARFWRDDSLVADVRASLTEPVKGGRTLVHFERRETKYQKYQALETN